MDKIFSIMKSAPDDVLWAFSSDIHTLIMDKYFSQVWEDNTHVFEYSNRENVSRMVNELRPESVIDVGCGFNRYKETVECTEFVGIDPFNPAADIKQGVYEYQNANPDRQFDAVLALGSINFGTKEKILAEIESVDKLTKSGGTQFWRVNPNTKHNYHPDFPLNELLTWYDWDEDFIRQIAEIYNYEIKDIKEEINDQGYKRLFFVFYKY